MNTFRSLLCLSLCLCLCAFSEIRIDGASAVVISADKSFDPIAKELALHLSLMTKKDVPLVAANAVPAGAYVFNVGKKPAGAQEAALPEEARWAVEPNAAYFYGNGKSIYNLDNVDSDFNIGFPTDYIVVWFASIAIIFDLVVIILNCIARIFNMLFLYLVAPPVIAAQPFDNGGKTKQWMTAFLVQSLSVFGTVISMRLLLLFLPMIVDPQLVLFRDQPILNALAKLLMIYGGFEAAKKASSILTGILADNAGMQAIQAGDMSASAGRAIGAVTGAGKAVAGKALGAAGKVAGFAAKPLTNLASSPFKRFGNWWSSLGDFSKPGGGGSGGSGGSGSGGGGGGGGGGGSPQTPPSGSNPQPVNQNSNNNPGPGNGPQPGPAPNGNQPAQPPPNIPQNLNHH